MKKLLVIALSIVMALACTGVVFAADITTETTGTTEVSYNTSQGFTVSIPANFDITTDEQSQTVTASNVLIPANKKLDVTMVTAGFADNKFNLVCDTDSKIPYTIKVGDAEQTNNSINVLSVASGATYGTATLKFATTAENIQAATKSGAHTDTLTFTVAVTSTPD